MACEDEDFREFVVSRWVALVRFAFLLTGDVGHAEDVVQTVLERAWRQWSKVRIERPEAYLRTAITRQAVSRYRWLRRRVTEEPLSVTAGAAPVVADGTGDRALRELLWSETRRLPARMRAVVVLRVWSGSSEAEAAEMLGCSAGSVKSQLSRGLARLRRSESLRAEAAERRFDLGTDMITKGGEAR